MVSRRFKFLLILVTTVLICSCGSKRDLPDLSAEELRKLMDGNSILVVIDTRTKLEYARGRIPKSLFLPEEKFYALELILPKDKDTPLVFYCRGFG
jgi:rhodanese-related sulfurtransferase